MESLDPRDQETAAGSVVNAAVWNHKFEDLATWLDSAPPDLARRALQAIDPAGYVSPEEFIPWMASQLDRTTGPVTLQRHFARWLSTEPISAYKWTDEQSAEVVQALTTTTEGVSATPWMSAGMDRYQHKHGESGAEAQ